MSALCQYETYAAQQNCTLLDLILESVGQWQTATSVGEEPLKLLVIDVVEKGQPNTVQLN